MWEECPEDDDEVDCRVGDFVGVLVCCMYRCSMVESLSIMMCMGRWLWSWAMSLMVVRTVSSAGVRVDVDAFGLGGSEAMISNEIL